MTDPLYSARLSGELISNSLVLFKADVYPGDCHGYIRILKTVLAFSKTRRKKPEGKKIVREVMLPTELRVKKKCSSYQGP